MRLHGMKTLALAEAGKRLGSIVRAPSSGQVFQFRHRGCSAILLSRKKYESLLETLPLLSVPGFLASLNRSAEDAKRGRTRSMKAVLGDER